MSAHPLRDRMALIREAAAAPKPPRPADESRKPHPLREAFAGLTEPQERQREGQK